MRKKHVLKLAKIVKKVWTNPFTFFQKWAKNEKKAWTN